LAVVTQQFLVKPFFIPSESMVPTLQKGDRVLVNRLAYRSGPGAQRGDVVVFLLAVGGYDDLIKRVVAVGGDRAAVHSGTLWLNGKAQDEPYVHAGGTAGLMAEQTVPAGKVFVMGDNRNDSADSRAFGPIDVHTIVGKALAVYWPPAHFGGVTARLGP
jgi:signal peptidase I